jgi:UDPglucose--hexose-1-phosphate uridylyltransferase
MLRHKLTVATEYFDRNGTCLYCDMLDEELSADKRVVIENDHYVAVEPYASHVPFETWIVPKLRQSSFRWVDPALMQSLAQILKSVLHKLYIGLGDPDYNLTIDTASRGDEDSEFFLWHIEILPRLTTAAGFELGSGMSINTMLPEEAASFLRDVATDEGAM